MVLEFVPQLGLEPLVFQQADSDSLVIGHIKLPNCDIQVSLDSRINLVLQLFVLEIGEGLKGLQ